MNLTPTAHNARPRPLDVFLNNLSKFPWKNTAHTLHERFREDRLGITAGSLTFTTIIFMTNFKITNCICFSHRESEHV